MMSLDSHVTLAVIFSFVSMLGTLGSIYVIIHGRQNEDTNKEVANVEQFVKINYKLDELCRNQATLVKNSEKTTEVVGEIQKELVGIKHTLTDHEKTLIEHENRLNKLENK